VTVPAEVLLNFIEQTGANPIWLLSGQGPRYRGGLQDLALADLSPADLIRKGLERLEERPHEIVIQGAESGFDSDDAADFVAVNVVPMESLRPRRGPSGLPAILGQVLAYRQWVAHPRDTVAARVEDDAMSPVLSSGSVVAIDRSMTDPRLLQGKIVVACPDEQPVIRWLDVSGRHLILRASNASLEYPLVPIEWNPENGLAPGLLIGRVVWSWSRFSV
jgi:hypothetical protein